jgi:nitrogen fixation protein
MRAVVLSATTVALVLGVGPAASAHTSSIAGFTPEQGPVGTQVYVTGSDFTDASDVQFSGASASFTVTDDGDLTAYVPSGAATGPISVVTPHHTTTSTDSFTLTATPSVTGFSPGQGPVGTQVFLTGTDFTNASDVQFSGVSASFTVTDDSDLSAYVPSGAATGPISVVTPDGTASSTDSFTVTETPSVTGFSPGQGPVGTQVFVTGSDFTNASDVQFSGVSASFTVTDDGDLSAYVPSGAATGPISVVTPDGTASSTDSFTVTSQYSLSGTANDHHRLNLYIGGPTCDPDSGDTLCLYAVRGTYDDTSGTLGQGRLNGRIKLDTTSFDGTIGGYGCFHVLSGVLKFTNGGNRIRFKMSKSTKATPGTSTVCQTWDGTTAGVNGPDRTIHWELTKTTGACAGDWCAMFTSGTMTWDSSATFDPTSSTPTYDDHATFEGTLTGP